jgi:hypothetical protein
MNSKKPQFEDVLDVLKYNMVSTHLDKKDRKALMSVNKTTRDYLMQDVFNFNHAKTKTYISKCLNVAKAIRDSQFALPFFLVIDDRAVFRFDDECVTYLVNDEKFGKDIWQDNYGVFRRFPMEKLAEQFFTEKVKFGYIGFCIDHECSLDMRDEFDVKICNKTPKYDKTNTSSEVTDMIMKLIGQQNIEFRGYTHRLLFNEEFSLFKLKIPRGFYKDKNWNPAQLRSHMRDKLAESDIGVAKKLTTLLFKFCVPTTKEANAFSHKYGIVWTDDEKTRKYIKKTTSKPIPNSTSSKMRQTEEYVNYKGVSKVVYVGIRGGKYINVNDRFVNIKSLGM